RVYAVHAGRRIRPAYRARPTTALPPATSSLICVVLILWREIVTHAAVGRGLRAAQALNSGDPSSGWGSPNAASTGTAASAGGSRPSSPAAATRASASPCSPAFANSPTTVGPEPLSSAGEPPAPEI